MHNEIFKTQKDIKETKLVLFSDLHYYQGYNQKILNRLLNQTKEANPNYICIAGDVLDYSSVSDFNVLFTWLENLSNIAPVLVVLGNHDEKNGNMGHWKSKKNKEYIKLYNDEEIKYISKEEKEVKNTEIFANNKIFAKKSGSKWGFVDSSGNKVVDYKYEKVTELNKYGFAGIKQNGKWGVVNNEGRIIVEPTYELDNNEPTFIGQYYQVIYGNGEIYYTK